MKKIWFLCAMLACFIFPNGVSAVEVDAFLNPQPVYQYENPADVIIILFTLVVSFMSMEKTQINQLEFLVQTDWFLIRLNC